MWQQCGTRYRGNCLVVFINSVLPSGLGDILLEIAENNKNSTTNAGLEQRPLRFVLNVISRYGRAHVIILLSVMAGVGCSVGSQYAVKNIVDVLARHDVTAVWRAFILLAGLIAVDNMSWRVGGWIAARTFVEVTGDIRRYLFDHTLGHAPGFFTSRRAGMLAGRISATGNAVFRIENMTVWNVLPPLFAVIGSVLMIALVDPLMGAVLVGVSLVLGAVLGRLAYAGRDLHHGYAQAAAAVDGQLVDVINNVGVVRAFGATLRERQRFAGDVGQEMDARLISLRYLEKIRLVHAVVTAILTACLLGWAVLRWQHGKASPGDVVLVITLGFTVLHGTRDLAVALVEMVQDWARLGEALQALLVQHDMQDDPAARSLESPRGEVLFNDVDFSYGESRQVLQGLTLAIEAGERVGLVGRSGSGKSTLLALLQRQYDPSNGRILIDGTDIAILSRESLTAAMSVVSQDVQLFHRSVMENIRYGRAEASDEEVFEAARAAHADAFIAALPQAYQTPVGERGLKLSGGQRQRLAIARAFLRDAPILLLDEATSALDSESEAAVHEALYILAAGRTVIAVAHRLSTLKDFDRIVVMENGKIVDEGKPDILARRPGPYLDLLRHQAEPTADAMASRTP
jgi:ATP-binding cassette subfamily B protein